MHNYSKSCTTFARGNLNFHLSTTISLSPSKHKASKQHFSLLPSQVVTQHKKAIHKGHAWSMTRVKNCIFLRKIFESILHWTYYQNGTYGHFHLYFFSFFFGRESPRLLLGHLINYLDEYRKEKWQFHLNLPCLAHVLPCLMSFSYP